MDGNGRWATRRGLPRTAGHRAGVAALKAIVEAAPALGVSTLTVFAFSADNWRRPPAEVAALMGLLGVYLRAEVQRLANAGVKLTMIGRRDRLAAALVRQIEGAERATAAGRALHFRVAVDYSAREAIADAVSRAVHPAASALPSRDRLDQLIAQSNGGDARCGKVDLLIRTGGEKRLSDFLLWECAYAELAFLDTMWPDFTPAGLSATLADFSRRERRFGGLGAKMAAAE